MDDAREDNSYVRPFQDLWDPYRRQCYYYEVVECLRRVVLTGIAVFLFPQDSAAQVSTVLLLALLFYMVSEVLHPYEGSQDMWMSRVSHLVVILSVYVGLLLKVDVSEERSSSQELFSYVLVTVHGLMIVAVIAEGVAICSADIQLLRGGMRRRGSKTSVGAARGPQHRMPSPVRNGRGNTEEFPVLDVVEEEGMQMTEVTETTTTTMESKVDTAPPV